MKICLFNFQHNTLNEFHCKFLIKKIILFFENQKFKMHELININVFDYVFINNEIAQKICDKFQIFFVRLFKFKKVFDFDDRKIQSIIHQILIKIILLNHLKNFFFVIHN